MTKYSWIKVEGPFAVAYRPRIPEAATTSTVLGKRSSPSTQFLIFGALLFSILCLHLPLLRLPYFWDEAGYYVPAARDLLLSGSLIPKSTVSNAHPPLVMAWLALWWNLGGFHAIVTRAAMLVIAAFTLMGLFRLALLVANVEVAVASTVCLAFYPVFFAQSSLAHLDMAAAGFTLWGLRSYLEQKHRSTFAWFALAALAKETAIVAPFALAACEVGARFVPQVKGLFPAQQGLRFRMAALVAAAFPLAAWFTYHDIRTGYIFGNPEFFRYNVVSTMHPVRILLASAMRVWQLGGYMNLWLLTIAGALAMFQPPQAAGTGSRPRIAVPVQTVFLVVIIAYVMVMGTVGGAVLARYMLPVMPLVILVWVSTLWRRVQYWKLVVAIVCAAFVAGWFVNPPYGFSLEDNLAYRDYIVLHADAERYLVQHRPTARVLTAWPASDEVTRPYLGYVNTPLRVVQVNDFSLLQVLSAADVRSQFDVALVFSTKYEPTHPILKGWRAWDRIKEEFFGFHVDLPPEAIAHVLGGDVIYSRTRKGQWIAVIDLQHAVEASARPGPEAGQRSNR
ncbi:MAG TPA: glycosyltransferase [Terriglobales bacterium]